jgi:Cu-processing system permease protein
MNAVLTIAGKEIADGLRNRWVLAATLLLGLLALSLVFLGSAPTGTVGASRLTVTVVSLSSLSIFLLPLIALLLSYESLVGEVERGTMLLLLSYPVARWQVVLGKFLGHVAILVFATVVGYGAAGLAAAEGADGEAWRALGAMVGTSTLLGAIFIALGYLVSVAVRDRGTAAGIAVAVWLVFVVLYDMALLGVLVADEGQIITSSVFGVLMLINPTDLYRMFNLSGTGAGATMSGMAGLAGQAGFSGAILLSAMAIWIVAPLSIAGALFARREL